MAKRSKSIEAVKPLVKRAPIAKRGKKKAGKAPSPPAALPEPIATFQL